MTFPQGKVLCTRLNLTLFHINTTFPNLIKKLKFDMPTQFLISFHMILILKAKLFHIYVSPYVQKYSFDSKWHVWIILFITEEFLDQYGIILNALS